MSRKLTPGMLLQEAKNRVIFVHRYKWSHDKRRKFCRRMFKDGLLVLVDENYDGWLYKATTK